MPEPARPGYNARAIARLLQFAPGADPDRVYGPEECYPCLTCLKCDFSWEIPSADDDYPELSDAVYECLRCKLADLEAARA